MKDKILYIVIGVLFVNALWGWVQKSDNVIDLGFLRTKHTEIRNEIKQLENNNNRLTNDVKRLKKYIVAKDSIIENANPSQLDSLFNDFFIRTRR